MSLRMGFTLSSILILLLALTGCVGGSGTGGAGPINGPFSNSSLNGTYAFSFSGVNQFGFLAVAGTLQANGAGSITGGTADINSRNGIFTNQPVSGSFNVHNNGQGTATVTTPNGTFDLSFVIVSGQHGLIIRIDGNSTASGSFDLQSSSVTLSTLAGSLVFNLSGIDSALNAQGEAGVFTIDASGNMTAGVQDTNDNGTISTNVAITPVAAAMSTPTNGRGTISITGLSTQHFVYYIVDNNHLNLIETDLSTALAGPAFRQGSALLSGSFAFTVGGVSTAGPFAAGGIINTDGAGNVLNTSTEDVNNAGSITQNATLTGTYSVSGNGRGTMSLNAGTINLAIYPSSNGVQVLEIDANTVATGTAFQQSGPFSNSTFNGNYGMNFTGVTSANNEVDSAGQFAADGAGHMTGAADFNNGGSVSTNLSLSGTSTVTASGRATGTLKSSLATQNIVFYVVNSNRVLFVDLDANLVAVGDIEHQ
ncbi:MAG TPA: hypothetical protein VJA94_13765 [Candidatus Angelobacter sp.]